MLQPRVRQVNTMPTATELKVALDAVSVQVTALGRQLEEALWAQTSTMQGQVHIEERLCAHIE